jgi:pimeloyl-ACP methyl ester carboxylesterase
MKDILLLHGAIGSKVQLEPLAKMLEGKFRIHLLNLPGHGGEAFPPSGFSIEVFADAVLQYLDEQAITTISFFGYSMGGYVAMYFARKYPQRVEKIITLATKFYWDETVAAKEIKMLQPPAIEEKIPAFAKELANRHAPLDWKEQLIYTQQLLHALGKNNVLTLEAYKDISASCLLMLGDRDKMVTLEETVNVYIQLPGSSLAVLPKTHHPIEKADLELLKFYIERFVHNG